jgi:carboxypeptidase C (cathepsin A)
MSRLAFLSVLFVLATLSHAQTRPTTHPATKPASEELSVSEHEVVIGGKSVSYRATAGPLVLKDDAGKARASMFFVAYERTGEGVTPEGRPVTYVFNGGPGAASVWLHLGALGPKRIALDGEGKAPRPPYRLVDNEYSWLDQTDLVFIDPVGTGYSRLAPDVKGDQFYGVEQDIAAVAEFIRLWTTKYNRWSSPKFIAGESYGTTRAAGLSEYLLDHTGIAVNGIVFVSTVLDFATLSFDDNNLTAYPLYLPSYAAVAWYHKKLANPPADVAPLLKEVAGWAMTDYAVALAQGDKLTAERRKEVVERLVRYTGLTAEQVERTNLRVSPGYFEKMLLADRREIIGRFDGRITARSLDQENTSPEFDPSLSQYYSIYASTFNDYVRRELKYESELTYEILSGRVRPWKFGDEGGGYLTVATRLRSALAKNPYMKLMFANGYFDLATPFFATDYTVDHLDVGKELRGNISETYYPGGHMLYHNPVALGAFREDVRRFIGGAVATTMPSR